MISTPKGNKFQAPKEKIGNISPRDWEKTQENKLVSLVRGNTGE
jgi:hypothetical protein